MIDHIACRDECKRTVADEDAAAAAGWHYLEVQKRWRCPSCERELHGTNKMRPVVETDIVPGAVIVHPRTGSYIIQAVGKMRLPSGQWVMAARYCGLRDVTITEFYRPVLDFGNFMKEGT
jgi:rubredoxin